MSVEVTLAKRRRGESRRIRKRLDEARTWALMLCNLTRNMRATKRTLHKARKYAHFIMGKLVN